MSAFVTVLMNNIKNNNNKKKQGCIPSTGYKDCAGSVYSSGTLGIEERLGGPNPGDLEVFPGRDSL